MAYFIKIPEKVKLYQAKKDTRVEVLVGGINTDNFAPSANFSFTLDSDREQYFFNICDDETQVNTDSKEEEWNGTDKITVKDKEESTFLVSENVLKIERVFETKPTGAPRYKLAFSPGVQFFYQPELTSEEIIDGCFRPDNVVGSYAIYCNRQNHLKDKDGATLANYGCGKIGHLYAPYWTDSSGQKVKGTQEIVGNILTFALPTQEWIDSAVLPITLDPDIGYTTAGSSSRSPGNRYGVKRTTGSDQSGTLESMSIAFKNTTIYDRYMAVGLYAGTTPPSSPSAGEVISSTLAGGYDTKTDEANDFLEFSFTGDDAIDISASSDYWLTAQDYHASLGEKGGLQWWYDTTPVQTRRYSVWSSPWTGLETLSGLTYNYSIFFTYTEDSILPINLITGTPVLGSPNLGQTHTLSPTGFVSGIPVLASPAIGQTSTLTASDITTGAPDIESPAVGQTHSFVIEDFISGIPELGTTSVGQTHTLSPADITTGTPVLGSPELGAGTINGLSLLDITAGTPALGTPGLGQTHTLSATGITNSPPSIGSPAIGQIHSFSIADITTGIASLGTPGIGQTHNLGFDGIVTGIPGLGATAIGQTHTLTAADITTGLPDIGSPDLVQGVSLIPSDILSGTPVLGSPALGQIHSFVSDGVTTGLPVVGSLLIGQTHVLSALGITASTPVLGSPALNFSMPDTPTWRIYSILAENRTYEIEAENRLYNIETEGRTYIIT